MEEQDEQIQVEVTSNPGLNDEVKSETNNDTLNEEAHTELDENTINEDEENLGNGNIDEEIGSQLSDEGEGNEVATSEEKAEENEGGDDGMQEDVEGQPQEVLDYLGVVSVHHDGYIRFWNFEVFSVFSQSYRFVKIQYERYSE